jgi:hypothetical protein
MIFRMLLLLGKDFFARAAEALAAAPSKSVHYFQAYGTTNIPMNLSQTCNVSPAGAVRSSRYGRF